MKDTVSSIKEMLLKKALGCSYEDIIDEYTCKEGELLLVKRKKMLKNYPPDVNAAKAYIKLIREEDTIESMTDEQLEREKIKLLNELKDLEEKNQQGEGGI